MLNRSTKNSLAALCACLAAPAAADVCHYGNPGTTVSIAPHAQAWAEVKIHNRLAGRLRTVCALEMDGRQVLVEYAPGSFRDPDWFTVEAPSGFVAVPWRVLLDDETLSSVLIYEQVGM